MFWHTMEGFVKKLKQNKSAKENHQRIKQRMKNYREFNIDI